jgi:selenide,water dikinase
VGRDALRSAGGVHALTDVTGYGLAGHAGEMAEGAGLTFEIDVASLPVLEGALPLAIPRYRNRASQSNRDALEGRCRIEPTADPTRVEFAFDPQTSGGLLIAIDPGRVAALLDDLRARGAMAAAVVGRVREREGGLAIVLH